VSTRKKNVSPMKVPTKKIGIEKERPFLHHPKCLNEKNTGCQKQSKFSHETLDQPKWINKKNRV